MLEESVVSEDTPRAIAALGGHKLAEFPEVRSEVLRPLVEKNLIYVRKLYGKEQYGLTGHAAAAVARVVGTVARPDVVMDLGRRWGDCRKEQDVKRKGKSLEEFVAAFLAAIPGFRIPPDGVRLRTESEELDVVIEIIGSEHHVQYGVLTVCECKNWASKAPGDVLSHLKDKLDARGCKFGIFVAPGDVLPGFRAKLKSYLVQRVVIALLTGEDFDRLAKGDEPGAILRDSYYATVKYTGERS
jgi:restriction endonuclease